MSEDTRIIGPVDYLVVEFPGAGMHGEGLPMLIDLVDRGIIRILDLTFIQKKEDGSVVGISIADLDENWHPQLAAFEGVSSGLLGDDDLDEAGAILAPGSSAGILVYENLWAAPFAAALLRNGAQLVAGGRIPVTALVGALDVADAST